MAALSIVIFMTSLCCLYLSVVVRSVPLSTDEETFQPLCSRSCSPSSDDSADGVPPNFPKYRCSCSQSCAVFGDCCYDSPYKNTMSPSQFEFVCLSVPSRGRFRAVASCQPGRSPDFCRETLGHQPPVTSRITNITYGNVFCASCNDDAENYVTWNTQLRCPSANRKEDLSSDRSRIIYDMDEFWSFNERDRSETLCKFHVHYGNFSFLDDLELRPCTTVDKISTCSRSWKDLSVLQKCRSYEDPVYFHDEEQYRNLHCAQCNHMNVDRLDCVPLSVRNRPLAEFFDPNFFDFCQKEGFGNCILHLSKLNRGRGFGPGHMFKIFETLMGCGPGQRRKAGRCRNVVSD